MKNKRDIAIFTMFGLAVFAGLLLFFSKINPLVVYDADDWLYVYELRKPIPLIHAWNPTKVFPETFMPLVSYFGALVINPRINNYCFSLTLAHALFSSLILTLYFVHFPILFYKREFASFKSSVIYGCFFLLLHFISHMVNGRNNPFALWSENLTCFYNYTLPVALNAALVMHFMIYGGSKKWFEKSNLIHKFVVAVWIYFALNSNLYSSVVLATYIGTELFLILKRELKEKSFDLKTYCGCNWFNLLIIFCWFGTNILELFGGRAGGMQKSFIINLPITMGMGVFSLVGKNIFLTILDIFVFVSWRNLHNKKLTPTAERFLYYIGFGLIYLTFLSATVEPTYIFRPQVTICSFFYIFMGMIACLNELKKTNSKYKRAPLVLLGTLGLLFVFPGHLFCPYNYSILSYDKCEVLTNDIISQFNEAEQEGRSEIVLEIPKFTQEGNWPLSDFIGDRYANALYKHKITKSYIAVKDLIITEEKNRELDIPMGKQLFSF